MARIPLVLTAEQLAQLRRSSEWRLDPKPMAIGERFDAMALEYMRQLVPIRTEPQPPVVIMGIDPGAPEGDYTVRFRRDATGIIIVATERGLEARPLPARLFDDVD